MPQYRWKGINLLGDIQKGVLRAPTTQILERELFSKDIGLLSCKEKKAWHRSVRDKDILFFFQRLGSLIRSGVYLHDALSLLAAKIHVPFLADVVEDIAISVEQGALLYEGLSNHCHIFEPLIIEMCRIGGESNVNQTFILLCDYLEQRIIFKKNIRQAAFMPIITGIFFALIFMSIIVFIVPRFVDIFSSMQVKVPGFTKSLFALSEFIRNISFLYVCVIFSFCIAMIRVAARTKIGVSFLHVFQLKVPYLRYFIVERDKVLFFNSLGLLLQSRVPLVKSLECVKNVIRNNKLKKEIALIHESVQSGARLSYSVGQASFIDDELLALLEVGERSGRLAALTLEAGKICRERLLERISFLTTIMQPLLLVLLACGVAGLLLAVYLPLLTLSYGIA